MTTLVAAIITAILGGLSGFGVFQANPNTRNALTLGIAVWLILLFVSRALILTPRTMWIENSDRISDLTTRISDLTTKRLTVSVADPYEPSANDYWLRFRVENPCALPITQCYGKQISYTSTLRNYENLDETQQKALQISLPAVEQSLPPDGHRYPWFSDNLPSDSITIPGNGGWEYLYILKGHSHTHRVSSPSEMGLKYGRVGAGDYELTIEVGSEVEAFQQTRVRLVLNAEGSQTSIASLEDV